MQPLFQEGGGPLLRAVFLVLVSTALMVVDHHYSHLEQTRSVLSTVIAPLRYAVDLPARLIARGADQLQSREALIDRVGALEAENRRLQARQLKFETLESENKRLRTLLGSQAKRDERVRVAELLSVDLDPYRQQVVVNKGSSDDVHRGQPLMDAYGVMGQIIRVDPVSSTALLISDPNHALPVQINRNGLRTIAEGTGEPDRLKLRYIPNNADVRVGDAVITSGLGGRFPPNYPVGRISEVERRPGQPFARVVAEPYARLDRSREVLLVWPDETADAGTPATAAEAADGATANGSESGTSTNQRKPGSHR